MKTALETLPGLPSLATHGMPENPTQTTPEKLNLIREMKKMF